MFDPKDKKNPIRRPHKQDALIKWIQTHGISEVSSKMDFLQIFQIQTESRGSVCEMATREVEIAGKKLMIHEHNDVCDPVTGRALTGSWLWDSAFILSDWIASQCRYEFDLTGKSVVELGAGTGLPGLTAAVLGASRVVLTDVAPLLPGLRRNVEENGLGDRVEVRELVWGSDESWTSEGGELGKVDLVLMSDVFYDASDMAALAKTLKRMCGSGTRIWSASEIRPWTGECLDELMSEGFGVVEFQSRVIPSFLPSMTSDSPFFAVFHLVPVELVEANEL